MSELYGVLLLLGLGAVAWLAFRQGLRVKPDDREDGSAGVQPPPDFHPPH